MVVDMSIILSMGIVFVVILSIVALVVALTPDATSDDDTSPNIPTPLAYISVYEDANVDGYIGDATVGLNIRVFNTVSAKSDDCSLDVATGFVTVPAGTYRVTAFSIFTTSPAGNVERIPPNSMPGYCILYDPLAANGDVGDNAYAVGTVVDTSLSHASAINAIIQLDTETTLCLTQQCVEPPDNYNVYLGRAGGIGTSVHISASLCLTRL